MLNNLLNSLGDNIKNFKRFHLSVAEGFIQNPRNKTYSIAYEITCIENQKKAMQYDHTESNFRGNECSNENLIYMDCVIPDVNDERLYNSNVWFIPEKIIITCTEVQCSVIYSKSSNKLKDNNINADLLP